MARKGTSTQKRALSDGQKRRSTVSRALELANEVNAALGKGAVMMGNDPYFQVTYLPTEIEPIDDLLQGGLPFGRFVEIFGDYSTLKSYVGLKAIASAQKRGMLAALIDTEHAFDPQWAKECGVNVDELVLKHPENGEQAIDTAEILLRGGVDIIVFDSVAATLPRAEQELKLSGDKHNQPARLASLMSLAMRKLTAANKKTTMLWINQTRINVGVMFGTNESVPGGKALPFYASYRIAVRKAGKVTEEVEVTVTNDKGTGVTKKKVKMTVAQSIRATVEKSKLNAPHRDVIFNFDFRRAQVDEWLYLCYKAMDLGLIGYERGLWWVVAKKPKKYRGKEEFQKAVTEQMIREMLNPDPPFRGTSQPDKSKDASQNGKSSKRVVRKSTRTAGQAGSKKTVVIKKRSTK